jgi:hypothetical protein
MFHMPLHHQAGDCESLWSINAFASFGNHGSTVVCLRATELELGTFVDWLSTNADSGCDLGWELGIGPRRVHYYFSRPSGDAPYQIISYHYFSVHRIVLDLTHHGGLCSLLCVHPPIR